MPTDARTETDGVECSTRSVRRDTRTAHRVHAVSTLGLRYASRSKRPQLRVSVEIATQGCSPCSRRDERARCSGLPAQTLADRAPGRACVTIGIRQDLWQQAMRAALSMPAISLMKLRIAIVKAPGSLLSYVLGRGRGCVISIGVVMNRVGRNSHHITPIGWTPLWTWLAVMM